MIANNNGVLMTTFGTQLKPINTKEGLFILTNDVEVPIDTPLADFLGTKKLFKAGSTVKGTLWQESSKEGKTRKVILVKEDLKGRYLINKNSLEPTTEAKVLADISKKEIENLKNKVENLLDIEDKNLESVESKDSFLDRQYHGFTGS